MASGLGLIVSGRLVQTEWTVVSETQFVSVIMDADNINHVVVFLTGVVPLPPATVAAVYFSWPDPTAPPNWQLLGHISNMKPSAIFKVSNLKKLSELSDGDSMHSGAFGQQQICHNAQIGVSVEPEDNARLQETSLATTNSYVTFAHKMLESLFNFVSSFAQTQDQMTPAPGVSYVPLDKVQLWYNNFQRRLQTNPNFWRN